MMSGKRKNGASFATSRSVGVSSEYLLWNVDRYATKLLEPLVFTCHKDVCDICALMPAVSSVWGQGMFVDSLHQAHRGCI